MTADRARAHEHYGIAAKPTIEERLSAVEKLLGVSDIAGTLGKDWVGRLRDRADKMGIGEAAKAIADIVDATHAAQQEFSECAERFKHNSFFAGSPFYKPFDAGALAFQKVGDMLNSLPVYEGKINKPESTPKPLPCPFCGSEPVVAVSELGSYSWVTCQCEDCPTKNNHDGYHLVVAVEISRADPEASRRLAIERWNKRA